MVNENSRELNFEAIKKRSLIGIASLVSRSFFIQGGAFSANFLLTIFLLLWQLAKKIFKEYVFNQITLLVLVILGILLDIFVFRFTSDLLILILTGLWILSVYHFKFKGKVSISLALGFLILCPFLLIFNKEAIAEKAAVWAYMFLLVGVIQMIIEYIRKEGKDAKKEA